MCDSMPEGIMYRVQPWRPVEAVAFEKEEEIIPRIEAEFEEDAQGKLVPRDSKQGIWVDNAFKLADIEPDALEELMSDDVALVSVMLANNETGVVQPVRELASAAHAHGALFHTDAIQGYLHIPFDVSDLGVDAMSVCGHKIGGPVASGALYLKSRTPLRPRIFARS